ALAGAGAITTSMSASAQTSTATGGDAKGAGLAFTEGQRAYKHGDFRHAAESFEKAYALLPKLPALWNAARAWQEGGEATRAANLYAKYLSLAPPTAPDRNNAIKSLNQLNEKLSRVEIHASDFANVQLDGTAVEGLADAPDHTLVVYVNPGAHVVDGTKNGEHSLQKQTISAGAIVSVVLTIEPKEIQAPPPQPPPQIVVEPHSKGFPPWVLLIGGGLTAVSLGVTIWSGLDTQSQKSTFTQTPTQQNLDDGRSKEVRTNILIGVTAGLAVLTGVSAVFVDWKGSSKEKAPSPQTQAFRVGVGPGSMMIEGQF
ncbi:MAG: tetratricopeptide repeat protein, partial [Polyangiaceae bacterium]